MPDQKHPLQPLLKLKRIKRALANPTADGLVPHYRFPVNDQNRYGVVSPMPPGLERLRARVESRTGVAYNHSVVLLYRGGNDCIGFHKDKVIFKKYFFGPKNTRLFAPDVGSRRRLADCVRVVGRAAILRLAQPHVCAHHPARSVPRRAVPA